MELFYLTLLIGVPIFGFALGLAPRIPAKRQFYYAGVIGVLANLGMTLPDGGPALLLGMLAWPAIVMLCTQLGRWTWGLLVGLNLIREKPTAPSCARCSYSHIGLLSDLCPECGAPRDRRIIMITRRGK